jgi:hypothetical protein
MTTGMIQLFRTALYRRIELYSFERSLYVSTLVPTAAVVAYGMLVFVNSANSTDADSTANQRSRASEFTLEYADGNKAIFRNEDGRWIVTIGSSLSSAGHVVSIEKQDGHWTVTTDKRQSFMQR